MLDRPCTPFPAGCPFLERKALIALHSCGIGQVAERAVEIRAIMSGFELIQRGSALDDSPRPKVSVGMQS